jgi:hypothetical protein
MGLHLPDIRLHEQAKQMDRVQQDERVGIKGIGAISTVRQIYFCQYNEGHEHSG